MTTTKKQKSLTDVHVKILKFLVNRGFCASAAKISENVGELINPSSAASKLETLARRGFVKKPYYGRWEITDAGRAAVCGGSPSRV